MKPFLEELAQLESEKGLAVDDDNRVRGTIASVVGDTFAAHMFSFQSPSSTYFCRLCYAKREDMQEKILENQITLRSKQSHNAKIENANLPMCGVLKPSPFALSTYFDVVENYTFDPMHDLWEGVIPKELKLLFHYLVCDKKAISFHEINCRLACFNYAKSMLRTNNLQI